MKKYIYARSEIEKIKQRSFIKLEAEIERQKVLWTEVNKR